MFCGFSLQLYIFVKKKKKQLVFLIIDPICMVRHKLAIYKGARIYDCAHLFKCHVLYIEMLEDIMNHNTRFNSTQLQNKACDESDVFRTSQYNTELCQKSRQCYTYLLTTIKQSIQAFQSLPQPAKWRPIECRPVRPYHPPNP